MMTDMHLGSYDGDWRQGERWSDHLCAPSRERWKIWTKIVRQSLVVAAEVFSAAYGCHVGVRVGA